MRSSRVLLPLAFFWLYACPPQPSRPPAPVVQPPSVPVDPTPQRPEVRYLALGDSYTTGTSVLQRDSFPSRLSELLQRRGDTVYLRNTAVAGYTVRDITLMQLGNIPAFRPTLVTLTAGTNDVLRGRSPDEFRTDVRTLFAQLTQLRLAPRTLLVLSQPDWPLSPTGRRMDAGSQLPNVALFNAILREETERFGARFLDLSAVNAEHIDAGHFARDGRHFDPRVYDVWAASLARIVE